MQLPDGASIKFFVATMTGVTICRFILHTIFKKLTLNLQQIRDTAKKSIWISSCFNSALNRYF